MFTMICPKCKERMKDSIDIFEIKNPYYECRGCRTSLKVSNVYRRIGEMIPVFITSLIVGVGDPLFRTTFERFVLQPLVVAVTIIVVLGTYIGLYPKKLKQDDSTFEYRNT